MLAAVGPKHQLSLPLEQLLVSLAGVLLGKHQLSLPLEQLLLVSLAGVLLGSGLRRLRPSFRVRQLSHRSKLHRKQVNLKIR